MPEPIIAMPSRPGDPSAQRVMAPGASFSIKEWRGSGPAALHVHHADDEAWHVLEGSLHFRFADRVIILTPRLDALIGELQARPDPKKLPAIFRKYESTLLEEGAA